MRDDAPVAPELIALPTLLEMDAAVAAAAVTVKVTPETSLWAVAVAMPVAVRMTVFATLRMIEGEDAAVRVSVTRERRTTEAAPDEATVTRCAVWITREALAVAPAAIVFAPCLRIDAVAVAV